MSYCRKELRLQGPSYKAQKEVISKLVQFQKILLSGQRDTLFGYIHPGVGSQIVNEFFEMVPGGQLVRKADRATLLMEHYNEVQMVCFVSKCDRSALSRDECRTMLLQKYEFIASEDADAIAGATLDFVRKLSSLRLDVEEFALLQALVLFTACAGLERRIALLPARLYVVRALRAHASVHRRGVYRPGCIESAIHVLRKIAQQITKATEFYGMPDSVVKEIRPMDIGDPISAQEPKELQNVCQDVSEEVCQKIEQALVDGRELCLRQRYWLLCDVKYEDVFQAIKFIEELFERHSISKKDGMKLYEAHFKEVVLFRCALKSLSSVAAQLIARRPADFCSSTVEDHLLDLLERTNGLRLDDCVCDLLQTVLLFTACPDLAYLDRLKSIHFDYSMLLRGDCLEWSVMRMSELHALLYNLRALAGRLGEPRLKLTSAQVEAIRDLPHHNLYLETLTKNFTET